MDGGKLCLDVLRAAGGDALFLIFFYLCAHIGKQSMSSLAGTRVGKV